MKPQIYIALTLLLCVAFAMPSDAHAQASGQPKALDASLRELVSQRRMDFLRKRAKELATFQANFHDLSNKKKEILRNNSVSEIAFEDVFRMLNLQKAELTIELSGIRARYELLKAEAERSTLKTKQDDAVAATQRELLQRYVANQSLRLEKTKELFSEGLKGREEVDTAESLLLASKLRLTEFDVKAKASSPSLVKAIFETSLEMAEKQAKLKSVQEMLANYLKSKDAFFELQQIKKREDWALERMEELNLDLWAWEELGSDF